MEEPITRDPATETPGEEEQPLPNTLTAPKQETGALGPIVGIIIIVILIALGGWYFWNTGIESRQQETGAATQDEEVAAAVAELQTQSTSDDVASIEADLEATDLDSLDAELENIELELTQ